MCAKCIKEGMFLPSELPVKKKKKAVLTSSEPAGDKKDTQVLKMLPLLVIVLSVVLAKTRPHRM